MDINYARRLLHFLNIGMTPEHLAERTGCTVEEVLADKAEAEALVEDTDSRNTVQELIRIAKARHMTTDELIRLYA